MPSGNEPALNPNLTTMQIHDLAHVLLEGGSVAVAFIDLGQLISRAETEDVDPRAVEIARARLEAARDRGNTTASAVLARLAEAVIA